jgi:hypothetical protein
MSLDAAPMQLDHATAAGEFPRASFIADMWKAYRD